MTLHGIWGMAAGDNIETKDDLNNLDIILCAKCPHNNIPHKGDCRLLKEKKGKRWEFSKEENKIAYRRGRDSLKNALCAEWVRYL